MNVKSEDEKDQDRSEKTVEFQNVTTNILLNVMF